MFTHSVIWLWLVGLVYFVAGLVVIRKQLATARGLYFWIALGPVFVAAPLAVFAAEHFVDAAAIAQIVPSFMPAHLFVAYFVGCALLAAATSLVAQRFVRLSATMLGVMFFLFVLMMDLPFAVSNPKERLGWILALRESAFAGGAWALAGSLSRKASADRVGNTPDKLWNWMVLFGRFSMALAVLYFGLDQILHPQFAPGVPDSKLTPTWVPLRAMWDYLVGAFLIVAGAALLINKRPRTAAVGIGILMTLLTVILYVPILAITRDPSQMTDGINFVADTLFFGGTALLVAGALPPKA